MLNYVIQPLKNHKDCIDACAAWAYTEWGIARGSDFKKIIERFTEGAQTDKLPITLVALEEESEVPIGMISLWETEKDTDPALSPWLASLFVSAKLRGKSVGKALVREIEKKAGELGYKEIYLQTDEALGYYPKLGYEPIKKALNDQTIFRKNLASS